ncbi:SGNH/GDSL hydrolase family protein [Rossellomorea aquimaris]|uniref:SGNH/GDSL hydrolase family protein n=1 Tax=Rossellomorea aquimaris TaxID=189382 RepID=UPI001CFF25AC|nr:SGNH/GDSL hydrolase family protein [Rossellomorea aquimaris]
MRALTIGLMIVTLFMLISGKLYWNDRIERVQAKGQFEQATNEEVVSRTDSEKTPDKKKADVITLDKINFLPKALQPKFREKVQNGQAVTLAVVGSASTSNQEGAWPNLLEEELMDTYGKSVIKVATKGISNKTSTQVINEKLLTEFAASKPDVLLIEPFLLYDNSKLSMDDRLRNLSTIIHQFKSLNSDITVMIQPSNPVYQAYYYPKEESELEEYALTHGYIYLDHWKAWPNGESNELLSYLTSDGLPNEKGNIVWARFLIEYFTQKHN